eukprot:SAG31_NODE_8935_length_1361_cov_0.966719_2_plen_80_part_00
MYHNASYLNFEIAVRHIRHRLDWAAQRLRPDGEHFARSPGLDVHSESLLNVPASSRPLVLDRDESALCEHYCICVNTDL